MSSRLNKATPVNPVLAAGAAPPEPAAPAKAKRQAGPVKVKVGFYALPEDADRARAAYLNTLGAEQHGSWSDFLAEAVMQRVSTLELLYNKGREWPGVQAGGVPTGRHPGQ